MKKRAKKIISIVSIFLILAVFAELFYLNKVVLPKRLKALIVEEIERATQKKALLQSVRFSLFKGLVLEDLTIYDGAAPILNMKEASCLFFILPIFKKQVIIPTVKITSPTVFAERRPDGSINILDLIPNEYSSKSGFSLTVHKISLRDGIVNFTDDTLAAPFTGKITDLDMDMHLSSPSKVEFNLRAEMPSDLPAKVESSGEYLVLQKELAAELVVKDLSPKEFSGYYENTGLSVPEGRIDAVVKLTLKNGMLDAELDGECKGLAISKADILAKLDSGIKAVLRYAFSDRQFSYSGNLNVSKMNIYGARFFEKVENVKGDIEFGNNRLSADNVSADVFGQSVTAKINLINFNNPLFDIYATSESNLKTILQLLADKFAITMPFDIDGRGKINVNLQIQPAGITQLNGYLTIVDASLMAKGGEFGIENVNGEVQFTPDQLTWSDVDFRYHDTSFKMSGMLADFHIPEVDLTVVSEYMAFKSNFLVNNGLIEISELAGRYNNSEFSVSGDVNIAEPSKTDVDIDGMLTIDLSDDKEPFKTLKDRLAKIKAAGRLNVDFSLNGNAKDITSCVIDAKIKSDSFAIYGVRSAAFTMDYSQKDGVGYMRSMRASLYEGEADAAGKIDLLSKELPYSLNAKARGVRIERLKNDTIFSDKDIAGTIQARISLNGFAQDSPGLSGSGKVIITNGKLWQLNLFKGLGVLIFTRDFSDIVIGDGYCNFVIKDESAFTDDLILKSDTINLHGSARIGFDKSIKAYLKAKIPEEAMQFSAKKNIAEAVGKYSLIEITGTLKEPKYKMRPSVSAIVEDITNIFRQE